MSTCIALDKITAILRCSCIFPQCRNATQIKIGNESKHVENVSSRKLDFSTIELAFQHMEKSLLCIIGCAPAYSDDENVHIISFTTGKINTKFVTPNFYCQPSD
jgi:hypothetical protein